MKRDKIETGPRIVTKADVTLTPKEIENFLHNAQLALCDAVTDEAVNKDLFRFKEAIVALFNHSLLQPGDMALILVSAAWDIYTRKEKK